jgi:hypothetical protein
VFWNKEELIKGVVEDMVSSLKFYKYCNQSNFGTKFLEGGEYVMPHIIIK